MSENSLRLALIGKNITHSLSPQIFSEILSNPLEFDLLDYSTFSKIPPLKDLLEQYKGLMVTTPYKDVFNEQIEHFDTDVAPFINCIKIDGLVMATNTDYLALREYFKNVNFGKKRIVILGSGVMAKITVKILNDFSLPFTQYYRKKDGDLGELNFSDSVFVINALSREFVWKNTLPKNSTFCDFNYAHENKNYLKSSEYIDGLFLLKAQAIHAVKYFNL